MIKLSVGKKKHALLKATTLKLARIPPACHPGESGDPAPTAQSRVDSWIPAFAGDDTGGRCGIVSMGGTYPCRRDCFTISILWTRIFFRSVLRLSPSSSAARIWLPPHALSAIAISGASTRSSTR